MKQKKIRCFLNEVYSGGSVLLNRNANKKFTRTIFLKINKVFDIKFIIVTLFLILLASVYFFVNLNNQYHKFLLDRFFHFGSECNSLNIRKYNAVFIIEKGEYGIKNLYYFLLKDKKNVYLHINNTVLLKDFFDVISRITQTTAKFTGRSYALNSIQRSLFEIFGLKADLVIVTKNFSEFLDTLKFMKLSLLDKHLHFDEVKSDIRFETNACPADLLKLLNVRIPGVNFGFVQLDNIGSLSKLLKQEDVEKEQLRVHIENYSGLDKLGYVLRNVLQNYGVNVVKLDQKTDVFNETKVLIDREEIRSSATYDLIEFLLSRSFRESIEVAPEYMLTEVKILVGNDLLYLLIN